MSETAGVHDPVAGIRERRKARRRERLLTLVAALAVLAAGRVLATVLFAGDPFMVDAGAALLPGLALALYVARSARRNREEAHPFQAFLAAFLVLFLLARAADWLKETV
jgi:hypothetical protein